MKKVLVAGLVCLVLLGISVPVIAANFGQQNENAAADEASLEIGRAHV